MQRIRLLCLRSLLSMAWCSFAFVSGCSRETDVVVTGDDLPTIQKLTFSAGQQWEFDHLQSLIAGLIDENWVKSTPREVRGNRLESSFTLPASDMAQRDPQRQFKLTVEHANSKAYSLCLEAKRTSPADEEWNVYLCFFQTNHHDAFQRILYLSCSSNSRSQDPITIWASQGPEFHHSYEFDGLEHYVSARVCNDNEMSTTTAGMRRIAASAESLRHFFLEQVDELERHAEAKINSLEAFACHQERYFAGPHGEKEVELIQLEPRVGEAEVKQVIADLKRFTAEKRALINLHHKQLYAAIMKTFPIDKLAVEGLSNQDRS